MHLYARRQGIVFEVETESPQTDFVLPGGWIPVRDRLPDDFRDVEVLSNDEVMIGWCGNKGSERLWVDSESHRISPPPTHWRELPPNDPPR